MSNIRVPGKIRAFELGIFGCGQFYRALPMLQAHNAAGVFRGEADDKRPKHAWDLLRTVVHS
jgi:hypothetical protein